MDRQLILKRIVKNAIVLALYVVLTLVSQPIAFSGIQFRIAEILVLLCFFNRDYTIGITLGCLLSNIVSPFGPWDLLIGTGATLIACLAISFMKHLGIAALMPIITNSFLVAIEYAYLWETPWPYWYSVGIIAAGEAVVMVVGYVVYFFVMKKEVMLNLIDAKRNRDFKW